MKIIRLVLVFTKVRWARHSGLPFGAKGWPFGKAKVKINFLSMLVRGRHLVEKDKTDPRLEEKSTPL